MDQLCVSEHTKFIDFMLQQKRNEKMKQIQFNEVETGKIYLVINKWMHHKFIIKPIKIVEQPAIPSSSINFFSARYLKIWLNQEWSIKEGDTADFGFFESDKIYELDIKNEKDVWIYDI